MLNTSIHQWIEYYRYIGIPRDGIFLELLQLIKSLQDNDLYLEHSLSYKDDTCSNFRGLVCVGTYNEASLEKISQYYNASLSRSDSSFIDSILINIKNGSLYADNLIIGFDFFKSWRYKFYYSTQYNTSFLTYAPELFRDISFSRSIIWYDLFTDSPYQNKVYFCLDFKKIIENKVLLEHIFSIKIYQLMTFCSNVHIAVKGQRISIDFKFNGHTDFLHMLYIQHHMKVFLEEAYTYTYISIQYDIVAERLDPTSYNLYFY